MPYLRATLLVLVLIATLAFVAPIQALAQRRGWSLRHRIQMVFCRIVCKIIGVDVTTAGSPPRRTPLFAVSNHLSWTDIVALASIHPFVFLAKAEVATWPVLGLLARLQGTIFVNRTARRDVSNVNSALSDALRDQRDIVIFAEGTSTDGSAPPRFKPAHFEALRDVDAFIAPVAIHYTQDNEVIDVGWYGEMTFLPHLWRLMKFRNLRCHIAFGEIIESAGKDRKKLASQTQDAVTALLPISAAKAPC